MMTTDNALVLLNAIWSVILVGIGLEMAQTPPDTSRGKWTYRILFLVFGSAVIVTTVSEAIRTGRERLEASQAASKEQLASESKLNYMQGTLDAIAKFESEYISNPPKAGSSIELSTALAILRIAQSNTPKKPSTISTSSATPAPDTPLENHVLPSIVSNTPELKPQALQLAKEMNDWLALISVDAPEQREPKTSEEQKKAQEFRQRFDSEWRDIFANKAIDMLGKLQTLQAAPGNIYACVLQVPDTLELVKYRKMCATDIENGVLKLKE